MGDVASHATVAFFRQAYLIANSHGLAWGEPPVGEVTDASGLRGVEGLPGPAYGKPTEFYLRALDLSLGRMRDLVMGLESKPSETILEHRRHGVEIRQRQPGFPG